MQQVSSEYCRGKPKTVEFSVLSFEEASHCFPMIGWKVSSQDFRFVYTYMFCEEGIEHYIHTDLQLMFFFWLLDRTAFLVNKVLKTMSYAL